MKKENKEVPIDPALFCLAIVARYHGISIDMATIRHQFGQAGPLSSFDLLRACKHVGLKAGEAECSIERLARRPMPAIVRLLDSFAVLLKVTNDKYLIQYTDKKRAESLTRAEFQHQWNGKLLQVTRRQDDATSTEFGLHWFINAVRKYTPVMREVIMASAFIQVFALVSPLVFMLVIDKVLSHRSLSTLDVLVFALAVISLFEIILTGLRSYLLSHTTHRIDVEMGAKLFRHLLSLPLSYFESRRVGDTVARIREMDVVRQFITGSAMTLMLDLLFTVIFLAVMFAFSPTLTMIVIAAIPIYFLISFMMTPLIRGKLDDKFTRSAENQSFVVEAVSGIESVKTSATEAQWQRDWEERLASFSGTSFRGGQLSGIANQAVSFISKGVIVLLLYLGAGLVMAGEMTVGQLIAFNMLAARVNAPILRIAQIWQEFQQVQVSIKRLADIFNAPTETLYRPGRASLPSINGDICFKDVIFRYRPGSAEVLSGVNFNIVAGEVVGIVGVSGSGKTTLAKLMHRLYIPERGRILIDGIDLAMVDSSWLRRQIGVVSQDGTLFNRSVRENIASASTGISFERVVEAAKLAAAHDFILALPDGYDTVIGERGSQLSGGQRQRIAIARALVSNPKLLIFDEATSALDSEAETLVQQNMRRITEGRTVIIIAHRLSTLDKVDRILTLEDGRIIEDDHPKKLLQKSGRFARLHQLQGEKHAIA